MFRQMKGVSTERFRSGDRREINKSDRAPRATRKVGDGTIDEGREGGWDRGCIWGNSQ